VVLGKHVFSQISSALAPLNQAFATAIKRRTNVLQRMPLAHFVLDREPLASFVEPLPVEPLLPDATLEEAVALFEAKHLDSCCVVDESRSLLGVLTRTDLVRSIELIAAAPDPQRRRELRVRTIMEAVPVAITLHDSTVTAVITMRDHGLSQLPIVAAPNDRRLIGIVRIERVMKMVFDQVKALGVETSEPAASRPTA
jgi:CBS domain-containing protein